MTRKIKSELSLGYLCIDDII